jgi:choline dehydrogenase
VDRGAVLIRNVRLTSTQPSPSRNLRTFADGVANGRPFGEARHRWFQSDLGRFETGSFRAGICGQDIRNCRRPLTSQYDFIVCGSGSSGSVVARRPAENPNVGVLLLEASGSDEAPIVTEAARWVENLGTKRDWKFVGQPNPHLKGHSMPLSMGKVLGGGSSINGLGWARGRKNAWDFFASESGETARNYASVLNIYRRMEDWLGASDATRRGTGGLVFVQSPPDPNPIAPAMVEGARSIGMPIFDSNNGRLMEDGGGASVMDVRVRDGKRLSVFRTYVFPYMDRPNLTVVTHALVTKLTLEGKRAIGVEIAFNGKIQRITAGLEVVLSLGAMHTPKVLILSRIGDQAKLRRLGIPVVQRLPGVGQNGAPTKTHTLNMLHRLIDGKPIEPLAVKPPRLRTY